MPPPPDESLSYRRLHLPRHYLAREVEKDPIPQLRKNDKETVRYLFDVLWHIHRHSFRSRQVSYICYFVSY